MDGDRTRSKTTNRNERRRREEALARRRAMENKVSDIIKKPAWKELGNLIGVDADKLSNVLAVPSKQRATMPKEHNTLARTSSNEFLQIEDGPQEDVRLKWKKEHEEKHGEEYCRREALKWAAFGDSVGETRTGNEEMVSALAVKESACPGGREEETTELRLRRAAARTQSTGHGFDNTSKELALIDDTQKALTVYREPGGERNVMGQYEDAHLNVQAELELIKKRNAKSRQLSDRIDVLALTKQKKMLRKIEKEEVERQLNSPTSLEESELLIKNKEHYKYLTNFKGWEERYRRVQERLKKRKLDRSLGKTNLTQARSASPTKEDRKVNTKLLNDFLDWNEF